MVTFFLLLYVTCCLLTPFKSFGTIYLGTTIYRNQIENRRKNTLKKSLSNEDGYQLVKPTKCDTNDGAFCLATTIMTLSLMGSRAQSPVQSEFPSCIVSPKISRMTFPVTSPTTKLWNEKNTSQDGLIENQFD